MLKKVMLFSCGLSLLLAACAAPVTPKPAPTQPPPSSVPTREPPTAVPTSTPVTISSLADVANKRIGVQAGTVYEAMVSNNVAFDAGSGGRLISYQNADAMIAALKAKEIDVALLGKEPAKTATADGSLKIVASDFSQQLYAIALPR